MKKLFISIFTAVFALFALGTSTFAWFSMNTSVSATGMQVKATSASSLVITDTAANIATTATNTIAMTAQTDAIIPATHLTNQKDQQGSALSYASGDSYLVHVGNPQAVDPVKGYKQVDGDDLYFVKSVNSNTDKYYIDYIVYIAAKGDQLNNQDLTAVINPADVTEPLYKAISIDYWVDGTYKATANFNTANTAVKLIEAGSIPSATAESGATYVTVLMRVYYDGALESETSGVAFVNNGNINTDEVTFGVVFTTADHA